MAIPLPAFFAKPQRSRLRISPGGNWLAWLARDHAGILNIWAQRHTNTGTASAEPIRGKQITFSEDRDICFLFFFSLDDRYLLYLREIRHASEMYHLHALTLDAEDPWSSQRDLISDHRLTVAVGFVGGVQIWQPPETPDQLLLAVGKGSLFWDVCRLHLDTGELTVVVENPMSSRCGILGVAASVAWYFLRKAALCCSPPDAPPGVPAIQWFPDRHQGFEVRGRVEITLFPELSMRFVAKSPHTNTWNILQTIPFPMLNMQIIGPSGGSGTLRMDFTPCGHKVDVHTCTPRDTTAYVRVPICGNSHGDAPELVIAHDPRCDISGFLCQTKTGTVQAVAFEHEREELTVIRDPDIAKQSSQIDGDLKLLTHSLEGKEFQISSRTADETTWVVFASGDVHPGDFYLYSRNHGCLTHIFSVRPQLQGIPLVTMQAVHVRARDDEDLLCYVSRPVEHTGRTVLFVHGGPMARDSWGYDPLVQLLCSRGLTVLQVNYRGSTGFGRHFAQLPNGNIDSMRHDVADAARWALAEGIVANGRLAVMGASWGGYEALCGMTFDSDLYACGVAIVPLSTVGALNTSKAFRGDPLAKRYWDRVYGSAAHDKQAAQMISPLFHVSKICRPLMLVHGNLDVRVPMEHSNAIAEAMKKNGIRGYYVSYTDEGHGLKKERNILDMWSRIERFLCRILELPEPPCVEDKWTLGHSAVVHWDGLALQVQSSL